MTMHVAEMDYEFKEYEKHTLAPVQYLNKWVY